MRDFIILLFDREILPGIIIINCVVTRPSFLGQTRCWCQTWRTACMCMYVSGEETSIHIYKSLSQTAWAGKLKYSSSCPKIILFAEFSGHIDLKANLTSISCMHAGYQGVQSSTYIARLKPAYTYSRPIHDMYNQEALTQRCARVTRDPCMERWANGTLLPLPQRLRHSMQHGHRHSEILSLSLSAPLGDLFRERKQCDWLHGRWLNQKHPSSKSLRPTYVS